MDKDVSAKKVNITAADPVFSGRIINAADLGAKGDGVTVNTDIFNNALQKLSAEGGGTLLIPEGIWQTGPIVLQSNVCIQTERGTLILFDRDFHHFPFDSRGKHVPQVSGKGLVNIAITGEGIFDASGDTWHSLKEAKLSAILLDILKQKGWKEDGKGYIWPQDVDREKDTRPYMVELTDCRNVLLRDITIQNAPKFALVPVNCENVHIDHVTVLNEAYAQNGDGIDISGCRNVVVENCMVSCGDDGIAMKSGGLSSDGKALLRDVLVQNCTVYHAHGGFVIGSNTDGGIENVHVRDCTFMYTDTGIRFKSGLRRGGLVHNIHISNIRMKDIYYQAVTFSTRYEDINAFGNNSRKNLADGRIPHFTDIYISDVICDGALEAIQILGLPQMPVDNIHFDNVYIRSESAGQREHAENITENRVRVITC